jgi:hypothetical protein
MTPLREAHQTRASRETGEANLSQDTVSQFTLLGAAMNPMNYSSRQNLMKAPLQLRFINRFAEVANDSIVQCADPVSIIRVGSNENRRNCATGTDEILVEFKTAHRRHLNVTNQARRFKEMRRCKEIDCGREDFDRVSQGSHEPSHGIPKELVILDDGNQRVLHAASWCSPFAPYGRFQERRTDPFGTLHRRDCLSNAVRVNVSLCLGGAFQTYNAANAHRRADAERPHLRHASDRE